ncbi:hypothetical protein [Parasphingorhabdus halotolerans]|uniref:hypothetical protein n=1 Tax=Parasphingorhabdus halotolerans TaxID=2725558 RepID=UPI001FE54827|nr:hypothetical protein [Parasphingorhabdus halotolerans]
MFGAKPFKIGRLNLIVMIEQRCIVPAISAFWQMREINPFAAHYWPRRGKKISKLHPRSEK